MIYVYCYLGPKLRLVVRERLASLRVESSEARWSSRSKSISQIKGYSERNHSRLLPLVTLALSGPEEALQWLLSQLLRYCFCGIWGNELKGLALITRGQKSLFPHWPALHHLFCYGVAMHGRNISVLCLYESYCGQEYTQGHVQALG